MALPLNANLAPAEALSLDIVVPTPRWTSFQRKLLFLSRNGITNFVAAATAAPLTAAQIASATEASLRAAYEGPLSATYIALTTQARVTVDRYVQKFIGGNLAAPIRWGLSDSAIGSSIALMDGDDPTVFRP